MDELTPKIEAIANYHCRTGENPLWDDRGGMFYWEDIPNGRLFRYDPRSGEHEKIHDGELVGGFTLHGERAGELLLFGEHRIMLRDPGGETRLVRDGLDPGTGRFNDVIADPEGRVFAGTMGRKGELVGGLYRVELDGSVEQLVAGTGCANGMGFTPDLGQFYWTDSTAKVIYRFDYDRANGELTHRSAFYRCEPEEGTPDGMTVDTEGNVWTTRWGGSAIYKLSPEGERLGRIAMPVGRVSSCVFGGENFDELYVTTAGGSDDDPPEKPDGTLYRITGLGATGRAEFRSRVQF